MWASNWRNELWKQLEMQEEPWDLLVIGGGITGAGILREAARLGLKALLIEQKDFAWGTSSRSSKLVHGGLRYLSEGRFSLTRASVHEREQLMQEGPGLIDPLGFLLTIYKGDYPGRWTMEVGLTVYDLLALRWEHKHYSSEEFRMLAPHVAKQELECGFRYGDAQTDDARLVLRVLQEAVEDGGAALNYTAAEELLWETGSTGRTRVAGARICDRVNDRIVDVHARVAINATGAWADRLRAEVNGAPRIRPLRGSHLIFPAWRLPLAQAISFWHPLDGRPVFVFPWEGVSLVGTTDTDHRQSIDDEPGISSEEVAYLMAAVEYQFPSLGLSLSDVISTFSGVRPVIGTGKENPSDESRDHAIWQEKGLLTVTGGKLTTFRLIAQDVLKSVSETLGEHEKLAEMSGDSPVLNQVQENLLDIPEIKHRASQLSQATKRRLLGRFGSQTPSLIDAAQDRELEPIPGSQALWAELRWAARAEGVVHLDDLLLRRVRLGLLLPEGGKAILPAVRAICQPELGWDDEQWEAEQSAYLRLWQANYSLPSGFVIDWKTLLKAKQDQESVEKRLMQKKLVKRSTIAAILLGIAAGLVVLWKRRRRNTG